MSGRPMQDTLAALSARLRFAESLFGDLCRISVKGVGITRAPYGKQGCGPRSDSADGAIPCSPWNHALGGSTVGQLIQIGSRRQTSRHRVGEREPRSGMSTTAMQQGAHGCRKGQERGAGALRPPSRDPQPDQVPHHEGQCFDRCKEHRSQYP